MEYGGGGMRKWVLMSGCASGYNIKSDTGHVLVCNSDRQRR